MHQFIDTKKIMHGTMHAKEEWYGGHYTLYLRVVYIITDIPILVVGHYAWIWCVLAIFL